MPLERLALRPPEQIALRPVYASDILCRRCDLHLLTYKLKSPKDFDYHPSTGENVMGAKKFALAIPWLKFSKKC